MCSLTRFTNLIYDLPIFISLPGLIRRVSSLQFDISEFGRTLTIRFSQPLLLGWVGLSRKSDAEGFEVTRP